MNISPAPSPQKQDLSLLPQYHPDEEKFERRVNLFKSSLSSLSQPEVDRLVTTLLEQVREIVYAIYFLKILQQREDVRLTSKFCFEKITLKN